MELTFLGTSAGVPCKTRNVTSMVFNPMNNQPHYWLFDCGEGTQHQMLHTAFNPAS